MPDFDYIARTEGGARKTGKISAENYNIAVENLQSQKLTVVKLTETDTSFDFVKPFLNRLFLEIEKLKNRVPLNILVFFTRQLSTMFSAGLTIEKAIFFLSQEEKHKKFKSIIADLEINIKIWFC